MRCRLYIDEVGNADLDNAPRDENVRFLSLTGITTFVQFHDETIQPAIDELKTRLFGHSQDSPVILHRREIIDRSGPFRVLNDAAVRTEFDGSMLGLIENLPYIVNTVTIDKAEHHARYKAWHFDPYHYCLRCLIERYVLWLNRHGWRGDVAAEPRYRKVDKKVKASFQRTWADGTDKIPASLIQDRLTSGEIKFFPKAQNVAAMQLCDLIAHPSFRAMRRDHEGRELPDDFGGKVARILEAKKLARNPTDGTIKGWGRKWLP